MFSDTLEARNVCKTLLFTLRALVNIYFVFTVHNGGLRKKHLQIWANSSGNAASRALRFLGASIMRRTICSRMSYACSMGAMHDERAGESMRTALFCRKKI